MDSGIMVRDMPMLFRYDGLYRRTSDPPREVIENGFKRYYFLLKVEGVIFSSLKN
jgi:hypothetical protein